jgi:hypothetical protein
MRVPGQSPSRQIKKIKVPRITISVLEDLERINSPAAGINVSSTQNYVSVPAR